MYLSFIYMLYFSIAFDDIILPLHGEKKLLLKTNCMNGNLQQVNPEFVIFNGNKMSIL